MTMKMTTLTQALLAMGVLASGTAAAQSYSRTEAITYENNTTLWVVGQTKTVTCMESIPSSTQCDGNDVMSSTDYSPTTALPLTSSAFGKLQLTATYNADGTLATIKDGNNKTTTFSNWKRGIPQAIAFPDSTSMSAYVDDNGWIGWVADQNGYKTCYSYDSMGRLSLTTYTSETTGGLCDTSKWSATSRSFVAVASAEYGIAAGHWRETVTTGNATKITYYDGMWRPLLVREYDAGNQAATERFTKSAYDAEGRVTFASYPSTSSSPTTGVWTNYDPLGRVTSVAQDTELATPLQVTTTTYNTGFTTTVTNPRLKPITTAYMTYDQPSTDWPVSVQASESATTAIARDPYGKPLTLTRSGGGVTPVVRSYTYYGSQELCRTVEPETGATLFGYDDAGNLMWSAAGMAAGTACLSTYNTAPTAAINLRKASRTYDARNRLLTLAFPDGNGNQSWTYTPDGLPSTVTTLNGGNAVANGYTYNMRRLLSGESMQPDTVATGWGIGYGYNGLGQVISETRPANVSVTYTVNALGQTTQVQASSDGGAATTIASGGQYYPNGALKQFSYGNGIVHTMTQNARQLPSKSTDCTVSGTCVAANRRLDLAYTYDENGNVAGITDGTTAARQTRTMAYDGLDRLTSTTSPMFGTASYVYDTLDNLKQVSVSGGTNARTHYYCYNAANQLEFVRSGANCSSSPSVINISYDVQGNLLQKTGTSGGTYTFDYGNRLRTVVAPSAPTTTTTYRYDADGRRVRQDIAGASLKYSYYAKDGRLVWQRDEPASKRISNLYLAGSLVAEYSRPIGSNTVTISYLHTDALGSPIAKTNSSGAVIETSEYEPYGKLLNRANDDRAGYTGHVMDAASGLTYMQQRYYDPGIGQFLSVDPVTAYQKPMTNFNRYAYATNNPYRNVDPDGRSAVMAAPVLCAGPQALGCGAVLVVITAAGACAASDACRGAVVNTAQAVSDGIKSVVGARGNEKAGARAEPGTKANTKNQESYTVRVQAQGAALKSDASVPLNGNAPIPAAAVQAALAGTQSQLTKSEQAALAPAFAKASQWVNNVAAGGGIGPIGSTSFNVPGVRGSQMRVDIEVLRGPVNIVESP